MAFKFQVSVFKFCIMLLSTYLLVEYIYIYNTTQEGYQEISNQQIL